MTNNSAGTHVPAPLLLMVVRYDRTVKQQLHHLRTGIKRVEGALSDPDTSPDTPLRRTLDRLLAQVEEIASLPGDEMTSPEVSVLRVGSGVAHPGRVIGFWANGTLTFEAGMPPLTPKQWAGMRKDIDTKVWLYTQSLLLDDGVTYAGTALNPAFS